MRTLVDMNETVDRILLSERPKPKPDRPRPLAVWTKTGGAVAEELRLLNVDAKFRAALNGCAILAAAEDVRHLAVALDELDALAARLAPTAAHCLGLAGLRDWTATAIVADIAVHAGNVAQGVRLLSVIAEWVRFQHFANNPAGLHADCTTTADL